MKICSIQSQSSPSEGRIPLITGPCTLNNFSQCSVYLFASLLVGLFIVIMNVCDGVRTHQNIDYWRVIHTHTSIDWPLICE